jgi:hypothetical protein
MPEPVVKITPDFKVGETVTHKGERTDHKVLAVTKDKTLKLEGLAGTIRPEAVEAKLPTKPAA